MNSKPTESIRLRLDKDLLRQAGKQAKSEQRTTSSLIRFALAKYLEEKKQCASDQS